MKNQPFLTVINNILWNSLKKITLEVLENGKIFKKSCITI